MELAPARLACILKAWLPLLVPGTSMQTLCTLPLAKFYAYDDNDEIHDLYFINYNCCSVCLGYAAPQGARHADHGWRRHFAAVWPRLEARPTLAGKSSLVRVSSKAIMNEHSWQVIYQDVNRARTFCRWRTMLPAIQAYYYGEDAIWSKQEASDRRCWTAVIKVVRLWI